MYYFPHAYSAHSYLTPVYSADLSLLTKIAASEIDDCLSVYHDIFQSLMFEHNLESQKNFTEAAYLMVKLLDIVEDEIQEILEDWLYLQYMQIIEFVFVNAVNNEWDMYGRQWFNNMCSGDQLLE